MSLRKRKFSNTNLSRTSGNKTRSGPNSAPAVSSSLPIQIPPAPPLSNERYQTFVLSVVDQSALGVSEVVEQRPPPTSFATVLQAAHASAEENKSNQSGSPSNPIPLPPPLPDENLKAAGILAELITLRGTHIAAVDVVKGRKSDSDKLVDRSVHSSANSPLVLDIVPNKAQTGSSFQTGSNGHPSSALLKGGPSSKKPQLIAKSEREEDSKFLLNCLDNLTLSEAEKQKQEAEDAERSEFAQELLLSMLVTEYNPTNAPTSNSRLVTGTERAVPIDCPLLSVSENSHQASSSLNEKKSTKKSDRKAKSTKKTKPNENSVCSRDELSPDRRETPSTRNSRSETTPPSLPRPPAGFRHQARELSPRDRRQSAAYDDEKDDDKPPSPLQQSPAIRHNDFAYASGPVRAGYGRDDFAPDTVGRNVL